MESSGAAPTEQATKLVQNMVNLRDRVIAKEKDLDQELAKLSEATEKVHQDIKAVIDLKHSMQLRLNAMQQLKHKLQECKCGTNLATDTGSPPRKMLKKSVEQANTSSTPEMKSAEKLGKEKLDGNKLDERPSPSFRPTPSSSVAVPKRNKKQAAHAEEARRWLGAVEIQAKKNTKAVKEINKLVKLLVGAKQNFNNSVKIGSSFRGRGRGNNMNLGNVAAQVVSAVGKCNICGKKGRVDEGCWCPDGGRYSGMGRGTNATFGNVGEQLVDVAGNCNNCGEMGHTAEQCMHPGVGSFSRMGSGMQLVGAAGHCYNCGQMGHVAEECMCPGGGGFSGMGSGPEFVGAAGHCYNCGQMGHVAEECMCPGGGGFSGMGSSTNTNFGYMAEQCWYPGRGGRRGRGRNANMRGRGHF